jgi:hypothetical protein
METSMVRAFFVQLLTAATLVIVLPAAASTAQEYIGCEGDCGDCGECGGAGGHCGGHHGGGLFGGHYAGGCKGPCYWYGGACGCGGGGCCYNCASGCDSGYMLPVRRAQWYNWNRNYAYTDYGVTTALVVPPTANLQTNYGWGVASSRMSRIDHQYSRNYPGGGGPFGGPFRPTPVWPSDTTQFGVYYVRGPW